MEDNTLLNTFILLAVAGAGYALYAGNEKQLCLWKTNEKTGRRCVHTCSRKRLDLVRDQRDISNKAAFRFEIKPTSAFQVEHCD